MNRSASDIVGAMGNDIFKRGIPIDAKIIKEVPIFINLLNTYFYQDEIFHGYINSIYSTWVNILNDKFIKLIIVYNGEYDIIKLKQLARQREMMNMASELDAINLMAELDDLSVSPGVDSLMKSFKKGGISKKNSSARSRKR